MSPRAIGADLGGTKCLAVAVEQGQVVGEALIPAPRDGPAVTAAMSTLVEELAGDDQISGVGVGLPGLVSRDGVLRLAPNLPGANGLEVGPVLAERLGVPVWVDNDATCAAWGEFQLGAGHDFTDVVMLTVGTGIGGGIITDGRLNRGANGFAGEIGHMVVDPHGPPCPCGQRGCWEVFASGNGLGRLARETAHAGKARRSVELAGGDPDLVRGEHVTAAAAEGDVDAAGILGHFAWWLALGMANLANIFDPQAFVVGGGLVASGEVVFDPLRAAFDELVLGADVRPQVAILPAQLGTRAGAVGAAHLGLETAGGALISG